MNASELSARSSSETGSTGESSTGPTASIVVLGGGEAGSAVLEASHRAGLAALITLVEPSPYRYDQPKWVRVGTEGTEKSDTRSQTTAAVPSDVTWVQERVAAIDPEDRTVATESGRTLRYDYLVVALGTEPHWDRIQGLEPSLGAHGICSVYGYEQAERTWQMIRAFEGGRAIFTAPSTPHKGGRTPLRVLRRAEAVWRDTAVRDRTELYFAVATRAEQVEQTYGALLRPGRGAGACRVYPGYELVGVRPGAREAVFSVEKGRSESRDVLRYDLLHVVPPMRPPALLERSGLAYRDGPMKGYLEVHPASFRHRRFNTVFGVGDVLGVEGLKTGERAREQASVVAESLERIVNREA